MVLSQRTLNGQKKANNIYPVIEVTSVAVKVVPEVGKNAYVPDKKRTKNGQLTYV